MPKSWIDTKPGSNQKKWEEKVDWFKFQTPRDGVPFNHIRPIGPIKSAAYHWIPVNKKDGGKTKFPMTCSDYDPETEETKGNTCPACKAGFDFNRFYFQNAIIRHLQDDKPARAIDIKDCPEEIKKDYREVGDESWSPVRVVKIPISCAGQLRDIVKLNRHKIKGKVEVKDVSDPKYGCDIFVKFDKEEKSPANKYNVQKGDVIELTEEEKSYKLYSLNIVETDIKDNEKSLRRNGYLKSANADDIPKVDDNELPEAPTEEEMMDVEEKSDYLTELDRNSLKKHIKEHALDIKVYKTDSDDDLKDKIRKAEKPSCYGNYEGNDKCFNCNYRSSCVEEESEDVLPF